MILDSSNQVVQKAGKLKTYPEIKFEVHFKEVIVLCKKLIHKTIHTFKHLKPLLYLPQKMFLKNILLLFDSPFFISPKLLFSLLHTLNNLIP